MMKKEKWPTEMFAYICERTDLEGPLMFEVYSITEDFSDVQVKINRLNVNIIFGE